MLVAPVQAGDTFQALSAQSEEQRADFFAEVVRSADAACPAVTQYMYKGESDVDGADYFTVRCPEGDFMLAFDNTGGNQATVVKCSVAQRKGVECWQPF